MAKPTGSPTGAKRAASPADPAEVREEGAVVNPATAESSARRRAASPARPRAAGPTDARRGKRGPKESYTESAARWKAGKEADRLRRDLREFASARPAGWGHDDWLAFLDTLRERGHDTSDPDGIGRMLERERLATVLSVVPGLGPKRVEALAARFETLWSARHAGVDEIASVPGIPRALAERVAEALRER